MTEAGYVGEIEKYPPQTDPSGNIERGTGIVYVDEIDRLLKRVKYRINHCDVW